MITSIEPILACSDLAATMRFYTETLGFIHDWTYGDPPNHGSVRWGGTHLMFSLNPELAARISGQELFINTEGIETLYARHQAAGVPIVQPLAHQPWGRDEFTVVDPNGYRLRFSGIAAEEKSSQPLPEAVVVEARLPVLDEYLDLIEGADAQTVEMLLKGSCAGAVARVENETIGMARAVFDAPGWVSVWDVQVRDDWQGQHVGEALMKCLLDQLRAAHPGAFVFLFTFRHGFYAKLGFTTGSVTIMQL